MKHSFSDDRVNADQLKPQSQPNQGTRSSVSSSAKPAVATMNRASFSPGVSEKVEVFGNEAEMKFLKDETARLTEVVKIRDETISGMHQRISDLDGIKTALSKETRKVSTDLKFERIASEGSKKKLAVLEHEITTLREERANLIAERSILRDRVLELENALNEERSKRLRDKHEIETLRRTNSNLEVRITAVEAEHRASHTVILDKLQRYETQLRVNEQKSLVVSTQAEDINDLTRKLSMAKDVERNLHQVVMDVQESLNISREETKELRAEVYRLQKELLEMSVRQSEKSRSMRPRSQAVARVGDNKRVSSAMTTTGQGALSAMHFTESFVESSISGTARSFDSFANSMNDASVKGTFSCNSGFDSQPPVVSPIASPHRPHATVLRRSKSMGDTMGSLTEIRDNGMVSSATVSDSLPPVYEIESTLSAVARRAGTAPSRDFKKRSEDLSVKNKTMYVGMGLGLKQEPTFSPKGSAKMMLKKIMDDFNNG